MKKLQMGVVVSKLHAFFGVLFFFSTNGIAVKKASFCCNWLLEETFLSSSV
jgi:uncharacterized membrane protein